MEHLVFAQQTKPIRLSEDEKHILRRQIAKYEVKDKIKDLFYVKRWKLNDVMRELQLDPVTLHQYLKEIKEDFAMHVKDELKNEVSLSIHNSYKNVLTEAWFAVDNAKNNYERIKALELIGDIEEKNVRVMQNIGLLPRVAEKQEVTLKYDFETMMDRWKKEREKIIEVKDDNKD
jgi:hypothetical protein